MSSLFSRSPPMALLRIAILTIALSAFADSGTPRVGFYRGSFDPPTKAHVAIMLQSLKEGHLAKLEVVVNGGGGPLLGGDKTSSASTTERKEMIESALREYPELKGRIEVSVAPYGVDVIQKAIRSHPEEVIVRVSGEDRFSTNEYQGKNVEFLVFGRTTEPTQNSHLTAPEKNVRFLKDGAPLGMSSTQAREAISEGRDVSSLLNRPVLAYLESHPSLYRKLPPEMEVVARKRAVMKCELLKQRLRAVTGWDLAGVKVPDFKMGQSMDALREGMIRQITESKKLTTGQFARLDRISRPIFEKISAQVEFAKRGPKPDGASSTQISRCMATKVIGH